jgi:hypothetical protein
MPAGLKTDDSDEQQENADLPIPESLELASNVTVSRLQQK